MLAGLGNHQSIWNCVRRRLSVVCRGLCHDVMSVGDVVLDYEHTKRRRSRA